MKVTEVKISQVIPYARNPRKNERAIAKVAASIKEFGFRQPIVVDAENVVIAGHTRLEAARQLGLSCVPIHVAENLSPTQIKAYRIADNRVADDSFWDEDMLALELDDLQGAIDLEVLGFEEDELRRYMDGPDFPPGDEDDQGDLGSIDPKLVTCPHCGESFDINAKTETAD